jgi:hypothetical protein
VADGWRLARVVLWRWWWRRRSVAGEGERLAAACFAWVFSAAEEVGGRAIL